MWLDLNSMGLSINAMAFKFSMPETNQGSRSQMDSAAQLGMGLSNSREHRYLAVEVIKARSLVIRLFKKTE